MAAICLIWRLKEYTNNKRPKKSTVCTFLKLQRIFSGKTAVKLSNTKLLGQKDIYVQHKHKQSQSKTKSINYIKTSENIKYEPNKASWSSDFFFKSLSLKN